MKAIGSTLSARDSFSLVVEQLVHLWLKAHGYLSVDDIPVSKVGLLIADVRNASLEGIISEIGNLEETTTRSRKVVRSSLLHIPRGSDAKRLVA